MTTLRQDLENVATVLRGITRHEVETRDTEVYVNFGVWTALVVTVEFDPLEGKLYLLTATAWDRSGGVAEEFEIGAVRFDWLPRTAKIFLDEQDRRADELEKMLSTE